MKLLVLGGTHHVGRAVVEAALARGDEVNTLTRGVSGAPAAGAQALHADRTNAEEFAAALGQDAWDAVVDTWSGAPAVVGNAALLLSGRAAHYTYVSSRSVYAWPIPSGADESAPVVEADPASESSEDYAEAKRGGELAAQSFDGPVLLARAGLILGPYERVGRLPYWLNRMAVGGRLPVPGPPDRPLQYVDARDLASWVLDAGGRRVGGAFNTVSQPGHTTMGALMDECARVTGGAVELVWVDPETVEAADVAPWTELPIWLPPTGELGALHDGDVGAAHAAGLRCRAMEETVSDTWDWLRVEAPDLSQRRPGIGMDADAEARLLAAHADRDRESRR